MKKVNDNVMKRLILLFTLIIFFFGSCNLTDDNAYESIEVTEKTAQLIKSGNEFGFDLFQKVYQSEEEYDNILVSPLSVSLALAMTYNGANGETQEAMEKTLKVYGLTPEEINQSYFELIAALKSLDPKVVLEIANAIFYHEDFEVETDFKTVNQNYYDARIEKLDFGAPSALETINSWVAEKTHDKIQTILEEITRDQVMFLLNAIYFKGIWQKEFNQESTELLPFYLEDGNTIQTQIMQRLDTLPYFENEIFSAVEFSYGQGNYNMHVFLPNENNTIQNIIEKLNKDNWSEWLSSFEEKESVDIKFPRLKYAYEITMNDVLSEMGMGVAFTGAADFTGINKNGGLHIGFVKHKSFIEVNEEGTEAAAVTVVAIERTSTGGPQKVPFYVNRPFLYAISEKDTGAILFIGTVKNPVKE